VTAGEVEFGDAGAWIGGAERMKSEEELMGAERDLMIEVG
jgi:hypothetical protein